MGLFSTFKDFLKAAVADIGSLLKTITDGPSLDRLTAMAVLVSRADGTIDETEIEKLVTICSRNMPHFTEEDIRKSFNMNRPLSDQSLMALVEGAPGSQADILVRAGCAIGGADGDFDDNEKKVVREVCNRLFLKPADYAL